MSLPALSSMVFVQRWQYSRSGSRYAKVSGRSGTVLWVTHSGQHAFAVVK
jgi:hypothetical protein